jgi:hypothetical protein
VARLLPSSDPRFIGFLGGTAEAVPFPSTDG